MKQLRLYIIFLITLASQCASAIVVKHFPYENRFETPADTVGWHYAGSDSVYSRHWVIDSLPDYALLGGKCLYLTENGKFGVSPNRVRQFSSTAYCTLDSLPAGNYILSFRYRSTDRFNNRLSFQISQNQPGYELTSDYSWYYEQLSTDDYWQEKYVTFTSDGINPMYLAFRYWAGNSATGNNVYQAPAIDAIQISPVYSDFACHAAPLELTYTRNANDALFTWAGNASEYEVQYFMNDTSANIFYTQTNVTTTSYTIDCAKIPEGSYTFRVRSICGHDTSAWVSLDYLLIYDISKHCLDYLNFDDPSVNGHTGYTWNPQYNEGVVDYGYKSASSRQTVHHMPRQKDAMTNYKLRAFPQGQPAAIRLGNWQPYGHAEDMVYTVHVAPGTDILKMQYALVMQLPGHDSIQQPHFQLEFLDTLGNLIDSCGYVDFTASNNLQGWHTEHVPGEADVIWKDWTLIGLNIGQYVGQTVQIRLTTKDCSEGAHYGYAYFTLQCASAKMEGRHCGMKPDHFTVEEGFNYRWYRKFDNPRVVLGTERTYTLPNSIDTATYCCDLINVLKPNCYFTMEASSLAFLPEAKAMWKYSPQDCRNYVQFTDSSRTIGVYWHNGSKIVVTSVDSVDAYYWDFGEYGWSTERNPKIAFSGSGDSLRVVLHVYYEECEDTFPMIVKVPALETKRTTKNYRMCNGSSLVIDGKTYTSEGDYIDTLRSWTGCDSLSVVAIRYLVPDTTFYNDTVCQSDAPYLWRDLTITQSGTYVSSDSGKVFHCDSILHINNVYFRPLLSASLDMEKISLCQGDDNIVEIQANVTSGEIVKYDLLFDPKLVSKGFKNIRGNTLKDDNTFVLDFSADVWPGQYKAQLVLRNYSCDSVIIPVDFDIYYSPESLITQRWNDFLAVRKSAFNDYGGFYDYQWFRDGQMLQGETSSELYLPDDGLSHTSRYQVVVTRVVDTIRIATCDFIPKNEPNTTTLSVSPSYIRASAPTPIIIHSDSPAYCQLFSASGILINEWDINIGDFSFSLPPDQGIYILKLITVDGTVKIEKLMVE